MRPTFSFEHLIAPCEPSTFLSRYWETQPLHLPRHDAGYYSALFSSAELELVLQHAKPQALDVRVVKEQVELASAKYIHADGSLNMNQLYKAYGEGHTVVVNSLQRFVPKLARLSRQLQELMNFAVEFNVYLTPAHAHGLHPHYDTHDVFVLQIEGEKTWDLYGSAQACPLLGSFQPVIPVSDLPALQETLVLQAGDVLYLPRGHIHDAHTTDAHSMHITIGVYPTQWLDVLTTALTQLSLQDVRFRQAVPVGYLNHDGIRRDMAERLQTLVAAFATQVSSEAVYEALTDQLIRKSTPLADDQFTSIHEASQHLKLHTSVVKRPHMRCRVTVSNTHARIHFPGNTILASLEYHEALVFVAHATTAFEVDALSKHLDGGRKLMLVQRLIRGGLLQLAPIPHATP